MKKKHEIWHKFIMQLNTGPILKYVFDLDPK